MGTQKDKKGASYKLPTVLKKKDGKKLPHQEQFCDFLRSVGERAKRYCKDNPCVIGRNVTDADLGRILSCVFVKNDTPTLYAKVQHNINSGQFYANFFVKDDGKNKKLEAKEVMGKRCTVNVVICPDSIFVSSTHVTLQVKVTQVLMEFSEPEVEQINEVLVEDW